MPAPDFPLFPIPITSPPQALRELESSGGSSFLRNDPLLVGSPAGSWAREGTLSSEVCSSVVAPPMPFTCQAHYFPLSEGRGSGASAMSMNQ
jgi:hypothetical protein